MSYNKVTLVGNLGKDPEVRTLNSGDRVCNLSLATSESWKDKNTGERKERTEWHRVVIYNDNLAKICEQYLSKGDTILIEGSLQTRKWTDQSGAEKYATEVVLTGFNGVMKMLKTKGKDGGDRGGGQQDFGGYNGGGEQRQDSRGNPTGGFSADLDDEIPF